ncbi:hypothetical protein ACFLVG_00785 [Chloroflexota bacterium]
MMVTEAEKGEIIMWLMELEHLVRDNDDAKAALGHLKKLLRKALDIQLLI